MPILLQDRITRDELRRNPDRLYVFGDNLEQKGLGGLARECRGEPNAVGIPTKRAPSMEPGAFFQDADYDRWVMASGRAWDKIELAILSGKTVVFPKGGLGTGLAELPARAPRIKSAIEALIYGLKQTDERVQRQSRRSTRRT